jgi:hypothetical protein
MFARLVLVPVLLTAAVALAIPRPAYSVRWGREAVSSDEARTLIDQVDRRLRTCDDAPPRAPLVLEPRLAVFPRALELKVLVTRSGDRTVLGSITTRTASSNRDAQLRALVAQVCREAGQL